MQQPLSEPYQQQIEGLLQLINHIALICLTRLMAKTQFLRGLVPENGWKGLFQEQKKKGRKKSAVKEEGGTHWSCGLPCFINQPTAERSTPTLAAGGDGGALLPARAGPLHVSIWQHRVNLVSHYQNYLRAYFEQKLQRVLLSRHQPVVYESVQSSSPDIPTSATRRSSLEPELSASFLNSSCFSP